MNNLYSYLSAHIGQKDCPIKSISINFHSGFDTSYRESLTIQYKDGTIEELTPLSPIKNSKKDHERITRY